METRCVVLHERQLAGQFRLILAMKLKLMKRAMIVAHAANIIAAGEQSPLCSVRFVQCNLRHPSKGGRSGVKIKFSVGSLELQRPAIVSLLLSFDVHNECRAAIKLLKF